MSAKIVSSYNKDHHVIVCGEKTILQSYRSIIAIKYFGTDKVSLSCHHDYSRTTMKYLKQFLGHGIVETRQKIKNGEYRVDIDINGELLRD